MVHRNCIGFLGFCPSHARPWVLLGGQRNLENFAILVSGIADGCTEFGVPVRLCAKKVDIFSAKNTGAAGAGKKAGARSPLVKGTTVSSAPQAVLLGIRGSRGGFA